MGGWVGWLLSRIGFGYVSKLGIIEIAMLIRQK